MDLSQLKVKHLLEEDAEFDLKFVEDTTSVGDTLKVLAESRLQSVPVCSKGAFMGTVDVLDLVTFCAAKFAKVSLIAEESYRQMEEFSEKPVKDLLDVSGRNAWRPIRYDEPLFKCIEMLSQPNTHRIWVINEQKDVVGVISQSKVLNWLDKHKSQIKNYEKVVQSAVKSWAPTRDVISIHMKKFVIEAFSTIWEREVSGLAVVDDEGRLVGNISAADLRETRVSPIGQLIKDLYQPLKDFLFIRTNLKERVMMGDKPRRDPIFVESENTLADCIKLVTFHHIHRVYVVDSTMKPVSVISLSDILHEFVHAMEKNSAAAM